MDMIRTLFNIKIATTRLVTLALLAAIFVTSAGATCLFSALIPSSAAGSNHVGCHPGPVPSKSRPRDMQCCVSSPARALPIAIFSPRIGPQTLPRANPLPVVFAAQGSAVLPSAFAPSSGPPGVAILRI
jgi:hypothetical protein